MDTPAPEWLSELWIIGLGLAVVGLAVFWQRWYPDLTDSAPETLPTPLSDWPAAPPHRPAVRDPQT